jgi:hypothetical protein
MKEKINRDVQTLRPNKKVNYEKSFSKSANYNSTL